MKKSIKYLISISALLIVIIILLNIIISNQSKKIKYVFLFIGDGMSSNQVELTEIYNNSIENKNTDEQRKLSFTNFPVVGLRKNYSKSSYITDSAASATAIASGVLTYNEAINYTIDGQKVDPITYELKNKKMKIGIITNVSLNDATPSAFYGHTKKRNSGIDLAIEMTTKNFDLLAGNYIETNDEKEYNEFLNSAHNNGYIVETNNIDNISKDNQNIVLIENGKLSDYVRKSIEVLDNNNGFFIMAEEGKIDHCGHDNDALCIINEVTELDNAVNEALKFYENHKDETIIIVTGDHETGGLVLGNYENTYSLNLEKLKYIELLDKLTDITNEIRENSLSYEIATQIIKDNYDLDKMSVDSYENILKGNDDNIYWEIRNDIYNKAFISFTSNAHTAARIPVYVIGKNKGFFGGVYGIEEFNSKLRNLFNLN